MSAVNAGSDMSDAERVETLSAQGRAALGAGVVGNWVDALHIFLPLVALAPALDHVTGPWASSLAGAVAVTAMLLGRPVGAVLLGRVADRIGRSRTTCLATAGTALCALAIAVLPTHALLGPACLGLLIALRFAAGVLVAGEYSAAIPLAMEWCRPPRRGLASGLILSMAPLAQATIAFGTAGLLAALGPDTYSVWGWRLLFLTGAGASLGMTLYYRRHVPDSPSFHREAARRVPGAAHPTLRSLLRGRWARPFWQCFVMMSGLWLLTTATVLILTSRISAGPYLTMPSVAVVMGAAALAQAAVMILAGHWSTLVGRRRLLVAWGLMASTLGVLVWHVTLASTTLPGAIMGVAALQAATVSAYGPVAAYLCERFPTRVRSTGYGSAYSLSLVIPSLYPLYLPVLESMLGRGADALLVVLGGGLLSLGALSGPSLAPRDTAMDLDEIVRAGGR